MKEQHIHIVCFDIPYPISHGGFFDLFYKIKALHLNGIQITLHCYVYGRSQQPILNKYCKAVHYYDRKKISSSLSLRLPFIVASRSNDILINNLSKDNDPIILEGTHCTHILHLNRFPGRKMMYRLHNIEHIYYRHLFLTEKSIIKKWYYWLESKMLKKYEKGVATRATKVLAVAHSDVEKFKAYCPSASVQYLPVFIGKFEINNKEGTGNYCLYHGNLAIAENEEVCIELIQSVFKNISASLVIAGRNPSKQLHRLVSHFENIQLVANPSDVQMKALIQNAHINLVYSYNATGIKLKLIQALIYGRHCLVNDAAIEGTGLECCCVVIPNMDRLKIDIPELMQKPYLHAQNNLRNKFVRSQFDDNVNAQKLIKLLY